MSINLDDYKELLEDLEPESIALSKSRLTNLYHIMNFA